MNSTVFTIGHSTHSIDAFLALLRKSEITCVIDVRSVPYSQMAPQFNKPILQSSLREQDILYTHFKEEFGARHTEVSFLDGEGRVDFDKVRASVSFRHGIERLHKALGMGYRAALMCSEGNPFDCHRFALISYQLVREGLSVVHILSDRQIILNEELEAQLLIKYAKKLPVTTLFETVTRDMQLEVAYRLRGRAVAYRVTSLEEEAPDYD